jgi:hypothetical protein
LFDTQDSEYVEFSDAPFAFSLMASQGANTQFDFNAAMDFNGFAMPQSYNGLKPVDGEGNTSSCYFFGDEGIDTTAFDMFVPNPCMNTNSTDYSMHSFVSRAHLMTNEEGRLTTVGFG